ncbi:MAG: methyl-accepting chemotaxis protein [Negativicutes bacterium]|nr:methyl-accepting chemotaxis protein [Negativicutes bacterium]
MSIKTKTITLLVVSLLVTGLIMGGAGMYVLYRQTVNSTEVSMNNQSTQLAAQVSELIDSFNKSGKAYGADNDLQSGDLARIQRRISTYFGVSSGVDRLNFVDITGKRIAIAPYDPKILGDSLADRKFFQDTLKDQKSQISDVIINRATGVPSIIVTQPVKTEAGQMAGVVLQAVNLETLQNFLAQVKVGSTGVVSIVAQDGTLIAHTNKELVKEQKRIPEEEMKRLKAQTGHLGNFTDLIGRESVVLTVPIKNTNWFVVSSLPTKEFKDGFYTSLIWMAVSLGIGLVIIGIVGWRFLLKTLRPVEDLVKEAARIAEGNLAISTLGISSNDEVGRLAKSFEQMTKNLRSLMQQVSQAIEKVAASSEELNANAEQSAQAANQVAAAIAVTAAGVEKQSGGVSQVLLLVEDIAKGSQDGANAAKQALGITEQAETATGIGSDAVGNAIKQMNQIQLTVDGSAAVVVELGERSKEIGLIVETISGIASQTNLLALNAAIEAARAGEQGRGFSVVAEEVRKLAEQSQEAAKHISELIGDIQARTGRAVEAMSTGTAEVRKGTEVVDKAGRAFKEIEQHVHEVFEITKGIAFGLDKAVSGSKQVYSATKEVDAISREIASQAQNMSAATQEQSASIEEIASSSQGLAGLATELQNTVRRFKI